jgi:titin
VPNLTNGQQYVFGIYAYNGVNWGAGVGTNVVVPAISAPSAPATVIASPGNASATAAWSSPTDNGGAAFDAQFVFAYTTSPSLAYVKYVQVCATCTSATVTGLTNGTAYQFLAFARNSVGNGAYTWSNVITPGASPDLLAPTGVVATRGDTQAQLTWVAPITHLLVPVSYTVTAYKTDGTQVGTPTSVAATSAATVGPVTLSGLTNGVPVYFRVIATNLIFVPSPSAQSNTITPAGRPLKPTGVAAIAGDGQATVSWDPVNANGDPITGYTVTAYNPDNSVAGTAPAAGSPSTLTGLTNGNTYTFTVTATNSIGLGIASDKSVGVKPVGHPLAPTRVIGDPGDTYATIMWDGADGNGSPILHYTVTAHTTPDSPTNPSIVTPDAATRSIRLYGLTDGTTYYFTVVASTAVGDGPAGTSNPVVPMDPPPQLTFSPLGLEQGGEDIGFASGTHFTPFTQYTIKWDRPDGSVSTATTVTSDLNGSFLATLDLANTGTPSANSSTAYAHAFTNDNKCVATAGVLLYSESADEATDEAATGDGTTTTSQDSLAARRQEFDNVTRPTYWKNEAKNNPGGYSQQDLTRMVKGRAPVGSDGFPLELHHVVPLEKGGTNELSNLQVMTRTDHRLGGNYRANHPK